MNYGAADLALLVALLAGVTLGARNFFLVLPKRWQPRGTVAEALRYAPLAALLAITVPEIVRELPLDGAVSWGGAATDARLLSALVLAAVIGLTKRSLWGLAAGASVYLALLAVRG